MTALLTEIKIRARLRLNAARCGQSADRPGGQAGELRLKDCLQSVARECGFANWDHARRVLGAQAAPGDDMGHFWHAPGCGHLLNLWFADYAQAKAAQFADAGAFLLPYGRQFVVGQDDFVRELGLDPADAAWVSMGRDLVRGYGGEAWAALSLQRLAALRRARMPEA